MVIEDKNAVKFSEGTPKILREAIIECIEGDKRVHILVGNPISGAVTPSFYTLGHFEVSNAGNRIFFVAERYFHKNGIPYSTWGTEYKKMLCDTDSVLKITEVDNCQLVYQHYDCHISPITFTSRITHSAYGDIVKESYFSIDDSDIRINVPDCIDTKTVCQFFYGQVHHLSKSILKDYDWSQAKAFEFNG